jgi:hypothetical protein
LEDEEDEDEGESGGDKEMLGRLIVGELAARPDEGKRPGCWWRWKGVGLSSPPLLLPRGNLSLPFCSIISWRQLWVVARANSKTKLFVLLGAP